MTGTHETNPGYFRVVALFLFLLAEPIFTLWTPGYLQWRFTLKPEQAALFTTVYWVAKAISLFLNQFTVKWLKLRTFLLICSAIGLVAIALISNSTSSTLILVTCGTFDFFNSGLFSGLMSYGSLQISRCSPTLAPALLICGTVGTLLFAMVKFKPKTICTRQSNFTDNLGWLNLFLNKSNVAHHTNNPGHKPTIQLHS